MNISDLDTSGCNLYTNTAHNIKEAKRDIISKRREIQLKNVENDVNEIQFVEDEKNDSNEVTTGPQNHKTQKNDELIAIEDAEIIVRQNSRTCRKSTRNKGTIISNNNHESSSSNTGKKRRTSKRRKSNTVIVLDEDYPEPVSSTWIETKHRKLSEDSVVIVDSIENSLDIANVSDVYEDENEEITIVVKWKQTDVHKFQIRRFQNVSSIFDFFASKERVTADEILLLRNDKEVKQSDSPDSLGFNCIAMLDGDIKLNRIFYGKSTESTQGEEEIGSQGEDCVTVKVQAKNLKQPVEMTIKKQQKLKILIIKCCEKFNCPESKLTLKFDGEVINPKDTADDLGLEGGECFDAYIR